MPEIHADGLIDLCGGLAALLHQLLHGLQLFRGGGGLVQLDARAGRQLDHAVLGEVFHAAADIAAPLIPHGVRLSVHRDKGQLIEPAGNPARLVHIAHSLTGAHGNAQHAVVVQAHGPRQGGDIAVVNHTVGHLAEGVGDGADVDVLHLGVVQILGHLQKQRCVHGPVVDEHARGADTHRVHPGHVLRRRLQGGHDPLVVVVRIGIDLGKPDHLFGVYRLPVDHGGDLAVAPAGVKADAAALEMAAHRLGVILGGGELVCSHHLKGVLKDVCHIVPVKGLSAPVAVDGFQVGTGPLVPADIDLEAALHPENGLDQAVDVIVVGLRHLRRAVDKCAAGGHLAICPLHSDPHRLFCRGQKGPVKAHDGDKRRVQRGGVFQLHVDTKSVHSDSPLSNIRVKLHTLCIVS